MDEAMNFLVYEVKTAVILAVFYMFWRLLLRNDTFHRLNRIVLLAIAVLSFVLPLCVITVHEVVEIPYFTVSEQTPVPAETGESGTFWQIVLLVAFAAGAVAVLVHTCISLAAVVRIISSGKKIRCEDGTVIVLTGKADSPFSWMKYIVMNERDYAEQSDEIFLHEKAHISLHHSVDLLLVDFLTVLQWFNPAIWMLRYDLRELHEYEADDIVLKSGIDAKQYQYLLIRKTVGTSGHSIANSFSHSTLKNRITMMLRKKSTFRAALKALYVIPLAGISLAVSAETRTDYKTVSVQPDSSAVAEHSDSLGATIVILGKDTLNLSKNIIGNVKNIRISDSAIEDAKMISTGDFDVYLDGKLVEGGLNSVPKEDIGSINIDSKSGRMDITSKGKILDGVADVYLNGKKFSGPLSDIPSSAIMSITVNKSGTRPRIDITVEE